MADQQDGDTHSRRQSGLTDVDADTAAALVRLDLASQQVQRAGESVERALRPSRSRWWRRKSSANARARVLEDVFRLLMEVSEDLIVVGVDADVAMHTATAATNTLAAALGRPQISGVATAPALVESAGRRPQPMPWEATRLQRFLTETAALCRRLQSGAELVGADPATPVRLGGALIEAARFARLLEHKYSRLAESVSYRLSLRLACSAAHRFGAPHLSSTALYGRRSGGYSVSSRQRPGVNHGVFSRYSSSSAVKIRRARSPV